MTEELISGKRDFQCGEEAAIAEKIKSAYR